MSLTVTAYLTADAAVTVSWPSRSGDRSWIKVALDDSNNNLYVGEYDHDCVSVARAIAAKLIAAADELESKLSQPAAEPELPSADPPPPAPILPAEFQPVEEVL